MAEDVNDAETIRAVTEKMAKMHREGINICGGYFTAHNGNVQLSCSHHSDTQYSVLYCVGDRGWPFVVDKETIHAGTKSINQ